MVLPRSDNLKAQKLVQKIERGEFDENDVDALLIKVRNSCGRCGAIREVAHMVAHSDKGHSGLVRDNLRRMYLRMRYFQEYVSPKVALVMSVTFPSYILDLMRYEVDFCDEEELLTSFKVSPKSLKKKLDKLFKYDKAKKLCWPIKPIPSRTGEAIKHLLGAIRIAPSFTDKELTDQLIEVLKDNQLTFDEFKLRKNGDRIVLCILLLLHNRVHSYSGGKLGQCVVASETPCYPTGENAFPLHSIDKSKFGGLCIHGTVALDAGQKSKSFTFPVVTTSLSVSEWVDDSLFTLDDVADTLAENYQHFYVWKFDTDGDLGIDEKFRILKLKEA